jgi:hypothetical protein
MLLGQSYHSRVVLNKDDSASTWTEHTVFIGTYNLNGKLPRESLESWLLTKVADRPDLVLIGVQELIALTPGQYISADTDKLRLIWESSIMNTLNKQPNSVPYVLLRSIHLVALGIFAFCRSDQVGGVRAISVCSVKTGLMGMAANKGLLVD